MIPGIVSSFKRVAPPASFQGLVLSHNPFLYFRHNEASGTTAVNSGSGVNGTYNASASLGNAALYTGGGTSMAIASSNAQATYPGESVPSLPAMTIGLIYRPSAVAGIRQLITRDADSAPRLWQFRLNGASIEFVRIVGGVSTVARTHGLSAGVPAFLTITASSAGVVRIFVNGSKIGADQSVGAANYGGSSARTIAIGNRSNFAEGVSGDRFSESFIVASDLSEADVLELAQAAGFA